MNYSVTIFIVLRANISNHFSDDPVAITINKIIPKLVTNQNKKMSKHFLNWSGEVCWVEAPQDDLIKGLLTGWISPSGN